MIFRIGKLRCLTSQCWPDPCLQKLALSVGLVLMLALPNLSYATTYYVDSQAGNDAFDGLSPTPSQGTSGPWKTIEKVNGVTFDPGDRILFKRGSVWTDETLEPKNGGSAGGTITINELINGQARSFQVVDIADNNCIYFGAYGTGSKPRFQCDGRKGIEISHNYLIFEDIHLANGDNNVLWFNNPNGNYWSIVSNIDITNCTGNALRSSEGGGNLWIRGIYIYDYATNGIYLEGSPSNPLTGVLVENCHVEDPLIIDKEDAIACHNDGDGNEIGGDVIIRNSRFVRSGEDGVDVTSGTFILVEGNHIEHCYESAVHIDKTWVNNVEVRGNFFDSNSKKKGLGDLTIRADNCLAVNNILVGTGHHSVFLERTSNTRLWNNVIAPGDRTGNFIWLRSDLSNIDIRNNIFDFSQTTQEISGTITSDIDLDYNCYYGSSPSQAVYEGSTFAEMQASQHESNGFWSDPKFMNPAKSEPDHFKLQTSSPCLDQGNDVALSEDYWGNERPQGVRIDVGVFESSTALPIELVKFEAGLEHGKVALSWITAQEQNNDYFLVERSDDAENFSSIGNVPSKGGNSTTALTYGFIDDFPVDGLNYYRLKQIDYSGAYSYSDIRIVDRVGRSEIDVFPNPFTEKVSIQIGEGETAIFLVRIFDYAGTLVHQEKLGTDLKAWDVPLSASGVYYFHLIGPDIREVRKLIKL